MKKIIGIILVMAMVLSLVGCGSRGEEPAEATATTEAAAQSTGVEMDEPKTIREDTIKIAFCVASMDTNTKRWGVGIEKTLSIYENDELKVYDVKTTSEKQE